VSAAVLMVSCTARAAHRAEGGNNLDRRRLMLAAGTAAGAVAAKSDDSIWFTDPTYGTAGDHEGHREYKMSCCTPCTASMRRAAK
jgi:hypothetical protein